MAEKTEPKGDAEKIDKILAHLDSNATKIDALGKRMDAMETTYGDGMKRLDAACAKMDADDKARKDAAEKEEEDKKKADAAKADAACKDAEKEEEEKKEKAKADAAKKDAEEEEKKKADAARADAAGGEAHKKMQAQIDALVRRVPADHAPEVRQRLVGFQSKAERVAQAFGDASGAPPCVNGETEHDYRVRLLSKYKTHSSKHKDIDLDKVQDPTAFEMIEDAIYADAVHVANNPKDIPMNVLLPRVTQDATGRKITRFVGQPGSCWNRFKMPYRFVKRWGDEKTGQVVF